LTEYAVVVCGRCGFARLVVAGTGKSRCTHCGYTIDISMAIKHFTGSAREAREVVFRLNASGISNSGKKTGSKRRDVRSFLSKHSVFTIEEFAAYFETSNQEAERRIESLLDQGNVLRKDKDHFEVVR